LKVVGDGQDGAIEERGEEINRVSIDARALVTGGMPDGVANVTWE
jgi:hypothetical protein